MKTSKKKRHECFIYGNTANQDSENTSDSLCIESPNSPIIYILKTILGDIFNLSYSTPTDLKKMIGNHFSKNQVINISNKNSVQSSQNEAELFK